ncbi:MAG: copper chaperone PCu(A)C [Pseudomonadota bacterium]
MMHKFLFAFLTMCLAINAQKTLAFEAEEATPLPTSNITIEKPYAFATMPGVTTGAAFMIIQNNGDTDDRLIAAKSDVAKITEIHENLIDPDDGTMMMRKIKGLDAPAGKNVVLEPKGYHIMFIKMTESLTMDGTVDMVLTFEKAGEIPVTAKIMAPGIKPKQGKVMPWDTLEEQTDAPPLEGSENAAPKEPVEERTDY